MIVGMAGVFYPHALAWLDRGLFVLENLVSAWELIFGLFFLVLIVYFMVAGRFRMKGIGWSGLILLILVADYVYFIVALDRWREMVEPFMNLSRLFR
jgi:hypothetical protein